ncbi:MAG: hypothetical protein WDO68_10925 [Gammaproteobacteria bacterium]
MTNPSLRRLALTVGACLAATLMSALADAQTATAPVATPTGVLCKDGSTSAKSGRGACQGNHPDHGKSRP